MGMRCIRLQHSYKVAVEFLVTLFLLFLLLLRFDGCRASSSSSPITTTHRCVEEERRALLQLRDSLNFPNGHALPYWVGDDCCKWKGVECDLFSSTSRVISIYISYERQSEQGTWYPNATLFTEFKQLQTLALSGNKISGWINVQALCQLHNLKMLWVGWNNLGDDGLPWCLGRSLPFLELVWLSGNNRNISSLLLRALCGSTSLRWLNLYGNNLSDDSLPPCLLDNNGSSLEFLDLRNSNLTEGVLHALCNSTNVKGLGLDVTENLPTECGVFHNLETLDLYGGDHNGSSSLVLTELHYLYNGGNLPTKCGAFRYLETLYISGGSSWVVLMALFKEARNLEALYLDSVNLGDGKLLTELVGLTNVKELYLRDNGLTDETLSLGLLRNLSMLEALRIANNNLKHIPTGICELKNLQELSLRANMIEGNVWPCLSKINPLEALDLSQNQITDAIPTSTFNNLTSLTSLYLSHNKLQGTLPFSLFANLSKLKNIDLSNNDQLRIETESPTWIPSFQLDFLSLDNCKLNNHIPSFLSTQYNLSFISLSYASLQGKIPPWLLYNKTSLQVLSLGGNHLDSQFPVNPRNETSPSLLYLDFSDNCVQGSLPTNIHELLPQLEYLNMSNNKLEGNIPSSFHNLLFLEILDLSNNDLVGEVPNGLTENHTVLSQLILSNNQLEAMPRLSNMWSLTSLRLDGNDITRPIAINASSISSLVVLDLSRNHLSGYMENWLPILSNLKLLLLRGNLFEGPIPKSLCQMQQLHVLDLSNNNLSGSIPSCLKNVTSLKIESALSLSDMAIYISYISSPDFKIPLVIKGNVYNYEGEPLRYMTAIDLSMNRLSSKIPNEMGDLIVLYSLNLSNNHLTGHIPKSFQKLERLESLDLSHNKFDGNIPPQLIELTFLSTFNVAFNHLSGRIPYEKNFATFKENSYIGNQELCGSPLDVNCSLSDKPSSQPHQNGNGELGDKKSFMDNNLLFYSWIATCYALGFWGVIGPLLFSRNWRRRYFNIMDEFFDWCNKKLWIVVPRL